MKKFEELQLTTTDLVDILPKRIASEIQRYIHPKLYGRQLLRTNKDLLNRAGRSIHLPKAGTVSAQRISEGTAFTDFQEVAFETVEVTPFKIGVPLKITQEAIDAAEFDVLDIQLEEAAKALANLEDEEIWKEFVGYKTATFTDTGDGSTTTYELGNSYVIEIISSSHTISQVDYYDGKVKFASAPGNGEDIEVQYAYADLGSRKAIDANTKGTLAKEDVLSAVTQIRAEKFTPNVLVVHPLKYGDLLKDSNFIDASKYGEREPLLNGEIGKFYGVKVLETTQVWAGVAVVAATPDCGWFVLKRNPDVKKKEAPEADSYEFYIYEEFAPKITNENAVALIFNIASDAADL